MTSDVQTCKGVELQRGIKYSYFTGTYYCVPKCLSLCSHFLVTEVFLSNVRVLLSYSPPPTPSWAAICEGSADCASASVKIKTNLLSSDIQHVILSGSAVVRPDNHQSHKGRCSALQSKLGWIELGDSPTTLLYTIFEATETIMNNFFQRQ